MGTGRRRLILLWKIVNEMHVEASLMITDCFPLFVLFYYSDSSSNLLIELLKGMSERKDAFSGCPVMFPRYSTCFSRALYHCSEPQTRLSSRSRVEGIRLHGRLLTDPLRSTQDALCDIIPIGR